MKALFAAASILVAMGWQARLPTATPPALLHASLSTGPNAMAVLAVGAADHCDAKTASRVSSAGVWVDGHYEHELLLFPASGRDRYDTLLGPFGAGRHRVELRRSAFWAPSSCLRLGDPAVAIVEHGAKTYSLLEHAPVLEMRADTIGEQTDVPLFAYVEEAGPPGSRTLRYTVVFSNEDGGTQTRALFARWGRTTDIEQVYEATLEGGHTVREEFQGPDHETTVFGGRRRGAAPVLLVATLNNMVTDRGRGIAAVRIVPGLVDLSSATRESTMDGRPWVYSVMARELSAEGKIASDAPAGDRWMRQAAGPRDHIYIEARLELDGALAAAWVQDRQGRRYWSNYQREGLSIDRDGWVRTAVAVGPDPASQLVEAGWTCLPLPGRSPTGAPAPGSCVIETVRAFVFGDGWNPGANTVEPTTLRLSPGDAGSVKLTPVR